MKAKRRGLTFIDKILLCLNCLVCTALIFSYLAGYIDPRKAWVFAFFGLAYPPLLLAAIIMAVYWLLRKSWYILLPVVTIAVGWNVLLNNIGFKLSAGKNPITANTLCLVTYNVHNFKIYGSSNDVGTRHEFIKLIQEQNPDIIGMQEFYTRKKGQYNMIDSIKKIMRTNNYYYEPFNAVPDESMGMAIFSKYPIVGHGLIKLTSEKGGNQCLYVDVERSGGRFRMYSVHLQSIHFEPVDYKYLGNLSNKGKTDINATKRLGGKLKNAFIKRSRQVFIVKDHAKNCPYPYIISGDFNDTPASFAVTQMEKGLKNAFREKGTGLGRTYNGDFPNYQIDYVMVSPQIQVNSYHIIKKKLSDHYALRTELMLK